MTRPEFSPEVEAWAHVIRTTKSERRLINLNQEFVDMGLGSRQHFESLSVYPSTIVRSWVASIAPKVLGREAAPLLERLARDRDAVTRDTARSELERLGEEFVPSLLPGFRLDIKKKKDMYGTGRFAMLFLARHRDREAIPLLRKYAEGRDPRHYVYRMPLVIADYIEDPSAIVDRIRMHDHEWFYWLVEAASLLRAPGAEDAFAAALALPVDPDCVEIIQKRLRPRIPSAS